MKVHAKQPAIVPASEPEVTPLIGCASAQSAEALESDVTTPYSLKNEAPSLALTPEADTSSPINGDALARADTHDKAPESEDSSSTEAALVAIEQANAIDRNPDNSVIGDVLQEEFSQARLDQLCARWDERDGAFWVEYAVRCELVYEIHKETAKPGCRGGFSAALRRIKLAATTAYDMVRRHAITIGEAEDPDSHDPRDDEEEGEERNGDEEQDENENESAGSSSASPRGARGGKEGPEQPSSHCRARSQKR